MGQRGLEAREKGYPYHTIEEEEDPVYHVHSDCSDGKRIEKTNLRCGGYRRRLCDECRKLVCGR